MVAKSLRMSSVALETSLQANCGSRMPPTQPRQMRRERLTHLRRIVISQTYRPTVVLATGEYKEKAIQQLFDATTYKIFTSDPTSKQTRAIQKTLDRLVREEVLPQTTARAISPKETSIARAYGLPKIRKPNNPLRMIMSLVDSSSYKLSKWTFGHIRPLIAGSE